MAYIIAMTAIAFILLTMFDLLRVFGDFYDETK